MTLPGYALRQLKAKPLRTLLTVLAFAVSVGLLGFLLILSDAMSKDWSPWQGQRVIVIGKTSFFDRLPIAYLSKIQETPGIQQIAPFDFVPAIYRENRPENQVPLGASVADPLLEVYIEMDVPKEQAEEWKKDPTGCLVGPISANKFGWKVGDRIVLKAPVNGGVVETTIRGILRYKAEASVFVHRRYFEGLTGDTGQVGMFWILAKTRDDVPRITAEIERKLDNAPVPIRAMTEKQWQLQFMQMLGNVKLLIGSIGLATAFALLLITTNSIAMSARERRGETAILRVLGFQKETVARLLLFESLCYGLLGALVGTGLIYLFAMLVGKALDNTQLAGVSGLLQVTPEAVGLALALSGGLAVTAAVVPAVGLTRRSIVQLIRESR